MPNAPAASCALGSFSMHTSIHSGGTGTSGIPHAMVYALYRALPGDLCLVATVIGVMRSIIANLAPASERQDHTTSPSASATLVRRAIRVHRIPTSRIVTIGRNVPLHRGRMRESIVVICPTEQAPMPATDWHDGQFAHDAHAEIARRASECTAERRRGLGKCLLIEVDQKRPTVGQVMRSALNRHWLVIWASK